MSLTSYQTAPPRVGCLVIYRESFLMSVHGGSGDDLLSHALRRSTIGAEGFHGRVRDGIGWFAPRCGHQTVDGRMAGKGTGSHFPVDVIADGDFFGCFRTWYRWCLFCSLQGFAAACDGLF